MMAAMTATRETISGGWHPGAGHVDPVSAETTAHEFVVRLSYGHGRQAWDDDRLRPVEWRAYAVDYAPPGAVRRHATAHAADWIHVRLPQSAFDEVADLAGFNPGSPAADAGGAACSAAESIRRAVLSGRGGERLLLEPLCYSLAEDAARRLAGRPAPGRVALTPRTLRRVVDYVDAALDRSIRLDGMAAVSGLSRFHFAKAFKRATGHSPYNYVLTRRLLRARDLLARTDHPLAEVAQATGFSSQAHFTDAFKRAFGVTPGRLSIDERL